MSVVIDAHWDSAPFVQAFIEAMQIRLVGMRARVADGGELVTALRREESLVQAARAAFGEVQER